MRAFDEADYHFMERAFACAKLPVSAPHPNPRVGCVIVKGNEIVGEGFHVAAGKAHAETCALKMAKHRALDALMYVTLEPCAAFGNTPPCVDQIIDAGIRRVVAPGEDPNPTTKGKGFQLLHEAGIEVQTGLLEETARELNKGFFAWHETGKSWVTVKLGATLDGKIATHRGESKWITSKAARDDVQQLRAQAGAIMTGIGTVTADDPHLNCRAPGASRNPIRVIVDSSLKIPVHSKLFTLDGEVIIATTYPKSELKAKQLAQFAEIIELPADPKNPAQKGVNCTELIKILAQREINEVLVEAGPTLAGSLLDDGLVDELIVYLAPSLLGESARSMIGSAPIQQLSDRFQGKFFGVQPIGDDLRVTLRFDGSL